MKRRKKLITAILSAVLIFCINFMPKVYGKYQHSVKDEDAFVIEFPIQNISAVVAETLAGTFGNILNTEESYNTLISAMEKSSGRANETYIGNVAGSGADDTKVIRGLFGLDEDKDIMYGDDEVTVMIKRENLDDDPSTDTIEGINTGEASGEYAGAEMTIYTTSQTPSRTANTITIFGQTITTGYTYNEIEVYAMVFSKIAAGKWLLVGQYKGKATSNNYSGDRGGEPNSFNTDTWKSTEVYYSDKEETKEIAVGTTLSGLVQKEYRAQANLAALKAGTDLPYTDFT